MRDRAYVLIFIIATMIFFASIILTITFIFQDDDDKGKNVPVPDEDSDWAKYDSYLFSIFWPPSSCFNKRNEKDKCYERVRKLGDDDYFIIHGLWPSYQSGKYMQNCNDEEQIYIDFNNQTSDEIFKLWPGLYSKSDVDFWGHEYNKHGYCYIKRIGKDPKNEYKIYFDKAISIFKDYRNLMEEILPDITYGLNNITKSKFKKLISSSSLKLNDSFYNIKCTYSNETKTNTLNEIRFNYDLDFNLLKSNRKDECPDIFQIYISNETKNSSVSEKYDYYIYSLVWNPSNCKNIGKECYKKLKEKELNILMIKGLWPSYKNGKIPKYCNLMEDINPNITNQTLLDYMNNYWVGTNETNQELWNEQYNNHGYCYVKRFNEDPDSNYTIYFQKSIDLHNKYNFSYLFKEFYNGIFPGEQKLNKTYLMSKLNEKFGNNTYALSCLKINEKYYFNEIRFKFDLEFNLINEGLIIDDCPEEFSVEFLENEGPQKQAAIGFNESFDIYFFTILWLGTTCKIKGEQCYNNIKDVPKNIFTIHGLWPNYKNGTLADWCNGKNDIEIDIKDKSLLDYMSTYYISGYHTNAYFWGHEYNKHGYCYNQRNNIDVNDYEKYFEKAKELYIKYNLSDIFINMFNNTIAPGDRTVNRTELEIYLNETGIAKDTYQIVCQNVTDNSGKIFPNLLEIRIRFDLEFNLLRNESGHSEFDCPSLFNVSFS